MEKSGRDSGVYFSLLDDFASELGSTLDDLASNWENTQQYDNEHDERSGNIMDDLGKRMAKPLFFHNPVYDMFYKDIATTQVKRPTLIPLNQLNGSNQGKHGKYEKKDKKSHHHGHHGIFSKITSGISRRLSHPTLEADASLEAGSPTSITSDKSTEIRPRSGTDHQTAASPKKAIMPTHYRSNTEPSSVLVSDSTKTKAIKKSPPAKSPRMSRPMSADVEQVLGNKQTGVDVASENSRPVPAPRLKTSPITPKRKIETEAKKTIFLSVSSNNVDASPQASLNSIMTKESAVNFGSSSSISSMPFDENSSSDSDVKTMADVITEVGTEPIASPVHDVIRDHFAISDVIAEHADEADVLKRNKTLRWTGTRRAPGLIRDFTRKQSRMQRNVDSDLVGDSSREVESITSTIKAKTIYSENDSRSNTPSQQTTSFGMGDDDAHNEAGNDADVSSSDLSDAPSGSPRLKTKERKVSAEQKSSGGKRESAFIVLSSFLPPAPRLKRTQSSRIRTYLHKMGTNVNNALGYAVTLFVEETLKDKEKRPLVLLHGIRSFLTDMKRYLISNPHIGLVKKIQKLVGSCTKVEVEGAVDDALDKLVLLPLRDMVYRCLVRDYQRSGKLQMIQEAIRLAKTKTSRELGIRETLIPPDKESLEIINSHFVALQRTFSPYFKLKELLGAVTQIYHGTKDLNTEDRSARMIGADDFLPLLVYSIIQCDFIASDIETQYIDGLLDPALLLGEGGYYLTTLISAIQVLLSIKRKEAALPNISDLQGFLKVGISSSGTNQSTQLNDDSSGDYIFHKTLHVPPAMTSRNLCQMISKKFSVITPENYCLHVVVNGIAHPLEPNECPQLVKTDLLTQFPVTSFYFSFNRRQAGALPLISLTPETDQEVQQTSDITTVTNNEQDHSSVAYQGFQSEVSELSSEQSRVIPTTILESAENNSNEELNHPSGGEELRSQISNKDPPFEEAEPVSSPVEISITEATEDIGDVINVSSEDKFLPDDEIYAADTDASDDISASKNEAASNRDNDVTTTRAPDIGCEEGSEISDHDAASSPEMPDVNVLPEKSLDGETDENYDKTKVPELSDGPVAEEMEANVSDRYQTGIAEENAMSNEEDTSSAVSHQAGLHHPEITYQAHKEDQAPPYIGDTGDVFHECRRKWPAVLEVERRKETVATLTEYFEYKSAAELAVSGINVTKKPKDGV